jgi:tRNA nucleotidyltransferase/poly(A) polymerase
LFTLLRNVGDMGGKTTVVRVAGGWVRDKLLGLGGKRDIDVVLDNLTGFKFASKLNAYNRRHNLRTSSIGYIQPNPENVHA